MSLVSIPFLLIALSAAEPEPSLLEIWKEEALLTGKDAAVWNQGDCQQLIVKYPGSEGSPEKAVLLHSTSFLAARIHHDAIQKVGSHKRDLYWVVTCGGVSTATFVHSFFKKLSNFQTDLTTSEKVQIAMIGQLFPNLSKVSFVWNEGAGFDRSTFSPWIMAPIGTAQRGLWTGRVHFQALKRDKDEAADWGHLNGLVLGALESLMESTQPRKVSLRSLHFELEELSSRMSHADTFMDRAISWFNGRHFFFKRGWEWMLGSQWVSNEFVPFSEKGQADIFLDFFFLGAKESQEIERDLRRHFSEAMGGDISFEVHTAHMSGFMRSVFEGREARAIEKILSSEPQVVAVPVISPEFSESRFFREAGILTYELLPLTVGQPFFQMIDLETLSGDEQKASEVEVKILRAIL